MSWRHDPPDRFTAGTVGQPGQRVFYLQSHVGADVVTLRLEKQQVRAMADYLGGLLEDLPAPEVTTTAPELVEPVTESFIVGNIGVAYDNDDDRIVVVAEELTVDEAGELTDDGETARFHLTRPQVAAFIKRAELLMQGGRPPCRLCGGPVDPDGHPCPRAN